jgi:hypothetical protein
MVTDTITWAVLPTISFRLRMTEGEYLLDMREKKQEAKKIARGATQVVLCALCIAGESEGKRPLSL